MKLEYTKQDLIECEEDAYKRGYEIGYKKGMTDCYKKAIERLEEVFEKYTNIQKSEVE